MTGLQKAIKYCAMGFGIFLIISIISAILGGIGIITMISGGKQGSGENFTETYNDLDSIDIDVSYSSIIVQPGKEFGVRAQNVSRKFSMDEKNGNLKIKEKKSWFWGSHSSGEIIITVPEKAVLDDLTIDSGAGKIEINQVTANQLDISQGAGVLTIRNGNFTKTDIDGGAGKIDISSSILHNLVLDAGVGKVDVEAMITGNSSIDCGVGGIYLRLLGSKEDYRIHVEKGLGSIKINGQSYNDDTSFGRGDNFIDMDGGIGSIVVDFAEPMDE